MPAQTEKAGPSYLEPWFQYQEMMLDFLKGLSARQNRSLKEAKSVRRKSTGNERRTDTLDQTAASGHLYQYEKFFKYWNNPPPQHVTAGEGDTDPPGHRASESQTDSEAQPYDLWYEYYLSLVRRTDKYMALWKSASDTFISIQSSVPEEQPTMAEPFKTYQETWQKISAWFVMPLPGFQKPKPAAFDYLFRMPGMVRFWTDLLGFTAASTWMSLLKKDVDNLIYETGRMKEVLNELKNQNLFSHGREDVMNEIVTLQRDAAARTMILAGGTAALKTAVHDLKSAVIRQNKSAHHPPKHEKSQSQPHAR